MLHIRDEAVEHLRALLTEGGETGAIRIAVMGGAQGTGLGLIIDEASDDDLEITHGDIPLIIDKKLMEYCQAITIGFRQADKGSCGGSSGGGFLLDAENTLTF